MNIEALIYQHPLLFTDLRALGLTIPQVRCIANNLSTQLGGAPSFNLCYVLASLNARDFARAISTRELANVSGITATLAQAAVLTVAPWVERFEVRAG